MPVEGHEYDVLRGTAIATGKFFDQHRAVVPWQAFGRAMSTLPGSKGGYLTGSEVAEPVDVLRSWSVAVSAGMMLMPGLVSNVTIPTGKTATTASWLAEGAAPSESPPTVGATSLTPHTGIALIKIPLQLLRQGEAAEPFVRQMLMGAAGELIDAAVFGGAGGVQPLGLVNTPGIGTQAGASLAHAGVLAMRKAVLAAGAREENIICMAAPAVQELLGARERASGGGRFLWDDQGILGRPAYATKTAPASTLIMGDLSQAVLGIWGAGMRIDIDPSQDFNIGGMVVRVLMFVDVGFPQPSAFCLATNVT